MFFEKDREFLRLLGQVDKWEVQEYMWISKNLPETYHATHKITGIEFLYTGTESLLELPRGYSVKEEFFHFQMPYLVIAPLIRRRLRGIHILYLLSG